MPQGKLAASFLFSTLLISNTALAQQTAPLEDVAKEAAAKSTLAAPGNAPFHLEARISEEKTHAPQWNADVEYWWQSPTVWRREFHSANFSQTLIMNNGKVFEQNTGTVFPELLRNLTVELVDTIPRFDQLAALHQQVQTIDGAPGQIRTRWTIPGTDGTTTKNINASIAITRDTGLFVYGGDIDWDAALHDLADFHGKQISRRITAQASGGPTLTATVNVLEDLKPDAKLFKIKKATPYKDQLRVVVVPELELRKLALDTPAPTWPDVSSGPLTGAMVMRVVVDRQGNVRSVDDYFSDNKSLQASAQAQIIKWRFHPFLDHGVPVQVISTMTFPFTVGKTADYTDKPPATRR
jgi:hypothetical protein